MAAKTKKNHGRWDRKSKKFDTDPHLKPTAKTSHRPTQETRAAVASAAATFLTQDLIALQLGIDVKTLRRHYRLELDTATERANATVVSRLFGHTSKSPVACFYWLQNRDQERWKHTGQLNHKHEAVGSLADLVLASYGKKPEEPPKDGK